MVTILFSGKEKNNLTQVNSPIIKIDGTWKLLKGTLIAKGDTTITEYTKNINFIKIINNTHFAFFEHDLDKGKNADAVFACGGGRYSLVGNLYTEHLEYCSSRIWEGSDFNFTIKIKNDTLIQSGIEKIDSAGIDRMNIEEYVRVNN